MIIARELGCDFVEMATTRPGTKFELALRDCYGTLVMNRRSVTSIVTYQ